ncbi:hypothetical protein [Bradyrhizobium genosp. P]|uniref:hypothetical protein n=1 Tax=Bradyrhizobium genosp. P TaxID=83641 RepID=UPI003CEFAF68
MTGKTSTMSFTPGGEVVTRGVTLCRALVVALAYGGASSPCSLIGNLASFAASRLAAGCRPGRPFAGFCQ